MEMCICGEHGESVVEQKEARVNVDLLLLGFLFHPSHILNLI